MTARGFGLFLICWAWLAMPWAAGAEEWGHTDIKWQILGRGLSFTKVEVFREEEAVETLAVVKIDPAANAFRVFHHRPQSITAWQQELKALVVFNGSYYCRDGTPCGLIITDGKPVGPWRNARMRGMFVAEPKGMSPDLPRATILDLTLTTITPQKLPWTQGVQSFPLLLDANERIRVRRSDKTAHRSVIATDRHGNILVFNTNSGYFTLYDLAQFLKESAFEVDTALNLDGGSEAQLYIKTKDFEYFSPTSWGTQLGTLLDQKQFELPTVVAVFPR
ncbi:MAG: phosphodiester glycosidase family protein [Desulfobaccales bacterium]|nr:phosphodiester glycosidase family protein [Desulfobaccales bacterium]